MATSDKGYGNLRPTMSSLYGQQVMGPLELFGGADGVALLSKGDIELMGESCMIAADKNTNFVKFTPEDQSSVNGSLVTHSTVEVEGLTVLNGGLRFANATSAAISPGDTEIPKYGSFLPFVTSKADIADHPLGTLYITSMNNGTEVGADTHYVLCVNR